MRIFVSEYLTCGAMSDEPDVPVSLLNEGRAMHAAIVTDFASLDGVEVVTTWDDRLPPPSFPRNVSVRLANSVRTEREYFLAESRTACYTFVIAPEFENLLAERWEWVASVGGRWLGSDADAIAICSDKLATSRRLRSDLLPMVETSLIEDQSLPPWDWPVVVKPRDGAGSLNVRRIDSHFQWSEMLLSRSKADMHRPELVQPFVAGQAISVGVIVDPDDTLHVLPTAVQHLSDDGCFAYTGGEISAEHFAHLSAEITRLVERIDQAIPGLGGYFGIDLIAQDDSLTIIEINPRLTTSYLGYRKLTIENLAERLVYAGVKDPVRWQTGPVRFTPDQTANANQSQRR